MDYSEPLITANFRTRKWHYTRHRQDCGTLQRSQSFLPFSNSWIEPESIFRLQMEQGSATVNIKDHICLQNFCCPDREEDIRAPCCGKGN